MGSSQRRRGPLFGRLVSASFWNPEGETNQRGAARPAPSLTDGPQQSAAPVSVAAPSRRPEPTKPTAAPTSRSRRPARARPRRRRRRRRVGRRGGRDGQNVRRRPLPAGSLASCSSAPAVSSLRPRPLAPSPSPRRRRSPGTDVAGTPGARSGRRPLVRGAPIPRQAVAGAAGALPTAPETPNAPRTTGPVGLLPQPWA